eukprot:3932305-Rhodomonas_salina.5
MNLRTHHYLSAPLALVPPFPFVIPGSFQAARRLIRSARAHTSPLSTSRVQFRTSRAHNRLRPCTRCMPGTERLVPSQYSHVSNRRYQCTTSPGLVLGGTPGLPH